MLEIRDLHSYYGEAYVLRGVGLSVPEGKVVALLGRNGMGKTTMIRSIMGLRPPTVRQGSISFRGQPLAGRSPNQTPAGDRVSAARAACLRFSHCFRAYSTFARSVPCFPAAPLGHATASSNCSHVWRSGAAIAANSFPAASGRCWPLRVR